MKQYSQVSRRAWVSLTLATALASCGPPGRIFDPNQPLGGSQDALTCQTLPEFFSGEVFPGLERACVACHVTGSPTPTALNLVRGNPTESLNKVKDYLAANANNGTKLLDKPLGKQGHSGGSPMRVNDDEYVSMKDMVEFLKLDSCRGNTNQQTGNPQQGGNQPAGNAATDPRTCDGLQAYFRDKVWTPFMATGCANCHNATPSALASATRMILVPATQANFLRTNLGVIKTYMAVDAGAGATLIYRKPSIDGVTHGGGNALPLNSGLYNDFRQLITYLTPSNPCQ